MKPKLIELNGEIGKFTIVLGNINIPLSEIYKTSGQKISR